MSVSYLSSKLKVHNEFYFNYHKSGDNCINKCILSILEHFSPSRYGFDLIGNKNYSPTILTHVPDNLVIGSIPIWNAKEQVNLRVDPSDEKFEIILLCDSDVSGIDFPKSVYKWPICYIQSSVGIDIDLKPSGDMYRIDRSGYAHVYNYYDVMTKNAPLAIRTRFDPPNDTEYFTRAFDNALDVIDEYITDSSDDVVKINKEHTWIVSVVSQLTGGRSLQFANTSADDSSIIISKNGSSLYNKTLTTFSRTLTEISSDLEKNNTKSMNPPATS